MSDKAENIIDKAGAFSLIAYAACLPVSISGAQICLGLLLALWLRKLITGESRHFSPTDYALAAFLLWSLIAALFSDYRMHSLSKFPKLWVNCAWFGLIAADASRQTWKKALYAMVISAALIGLYGGAQHYFGPAVPRIFAADVKLWQPTGGYFHAVGLFDHHLTFGNTMILCLLGAVGLVLVEKKRRWLILTAAFFIFVGVIFSYARSAWVALMFMAGLTAWVKGRRFVIATILIGAVAVSAIVALSPTVRDRLATTFMAKKNLERIYLWKTSVDMALDHPLTGVGPGVYRKVVQDYRKDYNIKWTTKSHAHNSFIMAAAQSGFVGMILLILVLMAALYDPVKAVFESDGKLPDKDLLIALVAAMAGFAFACMFQHNFGDAEVVMTFWFIAAAAKIFSVHNECDMPYKGKPKRH